MSASSRRPKNASFQFTHRLPAMLVDPANTRLGAHLGRRLADFAAAKKTHPVAARLARGEADFQTQRTLKLAPDNDEVRKLRVEVVTLLNSAPREHS
ncbi:MAG TPA: hypothetical protein VI386_04085 [Candidatus Sulfotelmatobacter sp.]